MEQTTALILVAIISAGSTFFGIMATSFRDWLFSEKEKNVKWLNDRRIAYNKFISIYSTPYSKSMEMYLKGLTDAAAEVLIYGDLELSEPIVFQSPLDKISVEPGMNKQAIIENIIEKRLKGFPEYDDLIANKSYEEENVINTISDLIRALALFRVQFPETFFLSHVEESDISRANRESLEQFFLDLRTMALLYFMPVFINALNEKKRSRLKFWK
jgi:hypothetical protein